MKKFFLVLALMAVWATAPAAQIGENAARDIAAQFMSQHNMGAVQQQRAHKAPKRGIASAGAAFYVFNNQAASAYVVVAGDDRMVPVLAYGDQGAFNADAIPENMQWWLDQYAIEAALLDNGQPEVDRLAQRGEGIALAGQVSVVKPMLKSQWGQGAPFNLQCPVISGKQAPTGCTATAMAQIMYYHKWPASTSKAIPEYISTDYSITRPELPVTTFAWSSMKDTYDRSETDLSVAANAAVAKLMVYCGQSARMNYRPNSSGGTDSNEPFVEYFKFSNTARKAMRTEFTKAQWETIILNELQAGRPVMYGGYKSTGGHSFVCDGYDGNGYFHFNWGWYGSQNGYFLLSSLNPDNGGIGSIPGADGYTLDQDIIFGLQPNTVSSRERNSVLKVHGHVTAGATSYSRSGSSANFTLTNLYCEFWNVSPVAGTYDMGWGLYNAAGTQLSVFTGNTGYTLNPSYYTRITINSLQLGAGLANGTYYLRPVCRQSGGATWYMCHNAMLEQFVLTINNNTLTLKVMNSNADGNVTATINSYGDVRKVGRPLNVNVLVRNATLADVATVYLFVDGTLQSANTVEVTPNSSAITSLHYVPTTAGSNTIRICADKAGQQILANGSVTVAASTAGDLTVTSYDVAGASNYTVQGTTLSITGNFKNNKTTAYADYVTAQLYKQKGNTTSYGYVNEISLPASISSSSTKAVTFKFERLDPAKYLVVFYYYNYDDQVKAVQTYAYTLTGGSATQQGDVDGNGLVNGSDVTALYNYLLSGTGVAGNPDVDGNGTINGSDVTALYTILLK